MTLLPVRCYTCNKVLGNLGNVLETWKLEHQYRHDDPDASLEPFFVKYKIVRYCCRRVLLTFHDGEKDVKQLHTTAEVPSTMTLQDSVTYPRIFLAR